MKYSKIRNRIHDFCGGSKWRRIFIYHFVGYLFVRSLHLKRAIGAWARKAPTRPLHILEVGGGLGQWPYYLTRINKFWNVISVDDDLQTVSENNAFFHKLGVSKAVFLHQELTEYKNEGAFDMALLVDVIQCYESTPDLLECVYNKLRPGGNVILTTFTKTKGRSFVQLHNTEQEEEIYCKDGFGMKDLKKQMKLQGFRRIKAHYFMGTYGLLSWRIGFQFPMAATRTSFGLLFFYLLPFYYLIALPLCGILNFLDSHMANPDGVGLIVTGEKKQDGDEC